MDLEEMKTALGTKLAELTTPTNEDQTVKGIIDVRKDPADRAPGTLDAKWGDEPPKGQNGYPDVYSTAVMHESHDGRASLIDRLFDSPRSTAPAEQAEMRQLFANADKGEPHSPMLQHGKHKHAHMHLDETLADQVVRVVGIR
jgi:hypothetical protein